MESPFSPCLWIRLQPNTVWCIKYKKAMGFPISLTRSKNIALYNKITFRQCRLFPMSSDIENAKSNDFNPALNRAIRWATLRFHVPKTGTRKSSHPRKRAKTCPAETCRLDDLTCRRTAPSVFSNSRVPLSLCFLIAIFTSFPSAQILIVMHLYCLRPTDGCSELCDGAGGEADIFSSSSEMLLELITGHWLDEILVMALWK